MKTDIDIKRDVEEELRFNPDLDATDIAVAVKDGVVTLSGFVRSYSQKWEAERTAKRVQGVSGLANDIEVRLPVFNRRPDPEIARDAVAAIQADLPYSSEHVRVIVRDGWITLEGQVEWNYSRERAEQAVRRVKRNQRRHQPHPAHSSRRAVRDQTKDRRILSSQCRARCQPGNGRGRWRPRHAQGGSPILGRTPRG